MLPCCAVHIEGSHLSLKSEYDITHVYIYLDVDVFTNRATALTCVNIYESGCFLAASSP